MTISNLGEIDSAAAQFLKELGGRRLVAFHAPMGAGKTTFITALCKSLGVRDDAVSSPTFALVNEYRASDGQSIFHFDFYRIEKTAEALDIGFYDYVDSGCLCLMEWPENVEEILPEETLHVSIKVLPDESRVISWEE
ncbi:MAG: tRNA (adenosine(37)-N6)-threonylcarbamoyltransferase complex ATPase subunit type 1 TsaE [Bacteroidales bacterium]|nr:tRNA (adenosine(37)-N6)-threonylcarbamoyltransferase complex ATPase subunit type 1 TsaE [Bacteroidales bacterium]